MRVRIQCTTMEAIFQVVYFPLKSLLQPLLFVPVWVGPFREGLKPSGAVDWKNAATHCHMVNLQLLKTTDAYS